MKNGIWFERNMVYYGVIEAFYRRERSMNRTVRTKRNFIIIVAVCAVLAVSFVLELQMNQNAQAAVLDPHPGLVGWWSFDEGTGSVAGDSSGNGNVGTIYGATWVTGNYGQALSFDGVSNNQVSIPSTSSIDLTSAFTIALWANFNTFPQAGVILWKGSGLNPTYGLGDIFSETGFRYWWTKDGVRYLSGLILVTTGVFHHIVYTYNGATLKCYVDGVDTNVNNNVPAPLTSYDTLLIGCRKAVAYAPFNGVIDEVRIYNRALSAAEIQGDFKGGPDFSVNLLTKVPKGTTQVITTLSWQGTGTINVTIVSPSQNYTESMLPEYQKTVYSTSGGATSMLNIKRLSVSVSALSSDQNWYVVLTFDSVGAYQITVEVQK